MMRLLWSLLLISLLHATLTWHRSSGMAYRNDEAETYKSLESPDDDEERDVKYNSVREQDEDGDNQKQDDDRDGQDNEGAYSQDEAKIQWNNKYHHAFHRDCGQHNGIFGVHSHFHKGHKDRVFNWHCRRVTEAPYTYCHWTGNENAETGNMNFTCPTNQVIRAVWADWRGHVRDRRWRFLCCGTSLYHTTNCYTTELVDMGEDELYHVVGAPRVYVGAVSTYKHRAKDRLWRFKICEYVPSVRGRGQAGLRITA